MGSEHMDKHAMLTAASEDASKLKPKHVVVAWYEDRVGDLLTSLAGFAPRNSTVSVICKEKPEVLLPFLCSLLAPTVLIHSEM